MHRAVFGIVVLMVVSAPAFAKDAGSDARKQIQAAYNRENAAAGRKDASGFFANVTPDYKSTDSRGRTVTVDQLRRTLPRIFAAATSIKASTSIVKFSLKGEKAYVEVKEHAVFVFLNPQTRKPSKLLADETVQTLWIKTPTGWKRKHSKSIASKQSLDGKPIPQQP